MMQFAPPRYHATQLHDSVYAMRISPPLPRQGCTLSRVGANRLPLPHVTPQRCAAARLQASRTASTSPFTTSVTTKQPGLQDHLLQLLLFSDLIKELAPESREPYRIASAATAARQLLPLSYVPPPGSHDAPGAWGSLPEPLAQQQLFALSVARDAKAPAGSSSGRPQELLLQAVASATNVEDLASMSGPSPRRSSTVNHLSLESTEWNQMMTFAAKAGQLDAGQLMVAVVQRLQQLAVQTSTALKAPSKETHARRGSNTITAGSWDFLAFRAMWKWLQWLLAPSSDKWQKPPSCSEQELSEDWKKSRMQGELQHMTDPQAAARVLLSLLPKAIKEQDSSIRAACSLAFTFMRHQVSSHGSATADAAASAASAFNISCTTPAGVAVLQAVTETSLALMNKARSGATQMGQQQQALAARLSWAGLIDLLVLFAVTGHKPGAAWCSSAVSLAMGYATGPNSDAAAAVPAMLRLLLAVQPSTVEVNTALQRYMTAMKGKQQQQGSVFADTTAAAPRWLGRLPVLATEQQLHDAAFMLAAAALKGDTDNDAGALQQLHAMVLRACSTAGDQAQQEPSGSTSTLRSKVWTVDSTSTTSSTMSWIALGLAAAAPAPPAVAGCRPQVETEQATQFKQWQQEACAGVQQQLLRLLSSTAASAEQRGKPSVFSGDSDIHFSDQLQLFVAAATISTQDLATVAGTRQQLVELHQRVEDSWPFSLPPAWQQPQPDTTAHTMVAPQTSVTLTAAAAHASAAAALQLTPSQAWVDAAAQEAASSIPPPNMCFEAPEAYGLQVLPQLLSKRMRHVVMLLGGIATAGGPAPSGRLLSELLLRGPRPMTWREARDDAMLQLSQSQPGLVLQLMLWLYASNEPRDEQLITESWALIPPAFENAVKKAITCATDLQLLQFNQELIAAVKAAAAAATAAAQTPALDSQQQDTLAEYWRVALVQNSSLQDWLRCISEAQVTSLQGRISSALSPVAPYAPELLKQLLALLEALLSTVAIVSMQARGQRARVQEFVCQSLSRCADRHTAAHVQLWTWLVRKQHEGMLDAVISGKALEHIHTAARAVVGEVQQGRLQLSAAAATVLALQRVEADDQRNSGCPGGQVGTYDPLWHWRPEARPLPQSLMVEVWKAAVTTTQPWPASSPLPAALGPALLSLTLAGWGAAKFQWLQQSQWLAAAGGGSQYHCIPCLGLLLQVVTGVAANLAAFNTQQLVAAAYGLLLLGHSASDPRKSIRAAAAAAAGASTPTHCAGSFEALRMLHSTPDVVDAVAAVYAELHARMAPITAQAHTESNSVAASSSNTIGGSAVSAGDITLSTGDAVRAAVVLVESGLWDIGSAAHNLVALTAGRLHQLTWRERTQALDLVVMALQATVAGKGVGGSSSSRDSAQVGSGGGGGGNRKTADGSSTSDNSSIHGSSDAKDSSMGLQTERPLLVSALLLERWPCGWTADYAGGVGCQAAAADQHKARATAAAVCYTGDGGHGPGQELGEPAAAPGPVHLWLAEMEGVIKAAAWWSHTPRGSGLPGVCYVLLQAASTPKQLAVHQGVRVDSLSLRDVPSSTAECDGDDGDDDYWDDDDEEDY